MRTIMKSERQVEGGFKRYLLKYELIANGFLKDEGEGTYYGVTVEQFVWSQEKRAWERYDSAEVTGFSESLKESMLFFEKIVRGMLCRYVWIILSMIGNLPFVLITKSLHSACV